MNEIKSGSEVEILPSFAFGEDGTKCYPDAHEVGKIAVVTDVLGNGEYAIKTKEGGIYWAHENDIRLPTQRAADAIRLCSCGKPAHFGNSECFECFAGGRGE